MNKYHESVLLKEAIDYLAIEQGKWYIDGTLGGGGHTSEILKLGGKILGIDQDQDAIDYVTEKLSFQKEAEKIDYEYKLIRGNFTEIRKIVSDIGISGIAGILLDFGVSSHQFDTPERGFSFQKGPLDMRMDQRLQVTASDLVNGLGKDELTKLFDKYGEEPFARGIAAQIVKKRADKPIETTEELVQIITGVVHFKKGSHPATRVFQALRIAVNDELYAIEAVLPQAYELLENSGRLVTITFHSLEDRIVKNFFLSLEKEGKGHSVTRKPIIPSEEEQLRNPRSRSAKLRVFQKEL